MRSMAVLTDTFSYINGYIAIDMSIIEANIMHNNLPSLAGTTAWANLLS